jgi:hypothetical protein
MIKDPICPCEGFVHPQIIWNPPGRQAIDYRIGDYASFRHALLLPRLDVDGNSLEGELTNWHPGAEGDLAVQMMEWWAYLADILTFYSDRIAQESYLQTAILPESVQRLIRLLGYRPRPGVAARGLVAALTVARSPVFTLPQGFQIQSKPGPGKQPQIFELDFDTAVQPADGVAALPLDDPKLLMGATVLLKGSITTVKADDRLLLIEKGWQGGTKPYALVTVKEIQPAPDPQGNANTRITFTNVPPLTSAVASQFRLLKSNQSAHLWQYNANGNVVIANVPLFLSKAASRFLSPGDIAVTQAGKVIQANGVIHLESIVRQIKVGDPVLLDIPSQPATSPQLVIITEYTEVIWYANGDPADPTKQRTNLPANEPLIPIPHSQLSVNSTLQSVWDTERAKVVLHYDWQEVGELIATPASTLSLKDPRISTATSIAFPPNTSSLQILLEDAENRGIVARASLGGTPPQIKLSDLSETNLDLQSPLRILLNLLPVSRGETVPAEILGSGNASLASQEFTLQKSPLTYLLSDDSTSGSNYKSTLRIWVDDIEWQEVSSFYGRSATARIFITAEDENQHTHIQFGDGINGSRLPSGVNNILARYRYGSGQDAPAVGSLTVIAKPYPNLKAIRNPVAVGGGADPESPEKIRRYAPKSILTFGRAVSGDDYEAIAALTPGVARAKVYWTWDGEQQRSLVKLYVGDDEKAREAALVALRGAADPNRQIVVQQATAVPVRLLLNVEIATDRLPAPVLAQVRTALIHPETGLLGAQVIQIGKAIYRSQIFAACLAVPGVLAVHGAQFWAKLGLGFQLDTHYRHDPGEGGFYQLADDDLKVNQEIRG